MHPLGARPATRATRARGCIAHGSPVLLGCIGMLGASLLIAWVTWSFTVVHAALFSEDHVWWIGGASLLFVLALSMMWGAVRSLGSFGIAAASDGTGLVDIRDGLPGEMPSGADRKPAKARAAGSQGGGTLSVCVVALLLVAISSLFLIVPLVPAEQLLRVPLFGDAVVSARAQRVSQYIGSRNYDSARRLAGLGLGGATVENLSTLSLQLDLVELLLANGADPDSLDFQGKTLLMNATDPLIIERLLLRGANRARRDEEGKIAGERALARWDFGAATRLIEPAGPGESLALAIREGRNAEVEKMLAESLDPDSIIELLDRKVSPLYYAAVFGNAEAVDLLLEHGASLDAGEPPPLQGAVEARSAPIVRRLAEAGADLSYSGSTATDPLFRAMKLESVEMVERLIELGGGRDPAYHGLLTYTNHPRIVEIVSPVIEDVE